MASLTPWSVVFGETPSATKWNIIGDNFTKIGNGEGVTDAWVAYTPTLSGVGFTAGNGDATGSSVLIGKTCFFKAKFVMGSTSTMTTANNNINFTLPYPAANYEVNGLVGQCVAVDLAQNARPGVCVLTSANTVSPLTQYYGGDTTIFWNEVDVAQVPDSAGNYIEIKGSYEIA